MVITIMMLAVLGVICGIYYERRRWVRAEENNKIIEVGGNLYRVTKTGENAG